MLILSRKPQQQIVIETGGVKIVIQICKIQNNQVRIGIEAPKAVNVYRSEIGRKIDEVA